MAKAIRNFMALADLSSLSVHFPITFARYGLRSAFISTKRPSNSIREFLFPSPFLVNSLKDFLVSSNLSSISANCSGEVSIVTPVILRIQNLLDFLLSVV